ncbi:MAG: peptidylprolyl isomerase, partial [Bacteroidetes bacterium]|nr:peptidylprolyl isomerase [Bacteroidota bacterium]
VTDPRSGSAQLEVDQLDPQIALMIDSLKPGAISQPQVFKQPTGELSTRIVLLKSRTEPHKANLKDDYSKVKNVAKAQKEQETLETWLQEKLPTYYLKIDPEYRDCEGLKRWQAAAGVE